ncbi:MAG: F0F1 ATP synthase subunit A [Phycisphaeraceae bacterium]
MNDFLLSLAAANPVGHVTDKPIYGQWYFSNVTLMLLLSGIITLWLIVPAAQRIAAGYRKGGSIKGRGIKANMVETVCVYLRNDVFKPMLGDQTDRFCPMLWTFFFFILINNLLGLVPLLDITALLGLNQAIDPATGKAVIDAHGHGHYYGFGGTATQSIWVTGTLAAISFIWFNGVAILKDPKGYAKHLTGGAPMFMWPVMVIVEIIGTFVKPIALALRLFANMTGGHIIVATLLSFVVGLAHGMGGIFGHGMGLIPLAGTIAIYMLELLVAFIQAYIFTFLSALFLSQLVVHHGHDDHEHEHEHEEHGHGHGEGHAAAH